jgi:hypothetical protein
MRILAPTSVPRQRTEPPYWAAVYTQVGAVLGSQEPRSLEP